MGMLIKPIFYFAARKLVCTTGAPTNIYGCKYRIQGQFSKSQGKCSNRFASLILGLSGKLFLTSKGWEGFTEPSKPSLDYHWSDNKYFNSNTVFSSFILDSDFGFKCFLEIVCTKITL